MNRNLIIAKYKENIDWTNSYKDLYDVIIYSKDENESNQNFQKLENIGREAHTYLYHIVNNYNSLADINVFLQGDPLPHCKHLRYILSKPDFNEFEWISNTPYKEDMGNNDLEINIVNKIFSAINKDPIYETNFNQGACFLVKKSCILKHSKNSYEKLLELSKTEICFPGTIERLWAHIWE